MPLDYDDAVEAVEEKLYEMLCRGGGDRDTITEFARDITELFVARDVKA